MCADTSSSVPSSRPSSYYLNNFEDGHKQDALDLVTGGYIVVPGEEAGYAVWAGHADTLSWPVSAPLM